MPIPTIRFENNDKAAHAVSDYLNTLSPSPQRFTLRPFNRFSTEFTEWWFIPSTEFPAYRHSKLFMHRFQEPSEESARFFSGLYVEKGLGKKLAGLPGVKPSEIMQSNWEWHDFLDSAKAGRLSSAISDIVARSQCQISVSLNAYEFNHVPRPDTERDAPYDWVEFTIDSIDGAFAKGPERRHSGIELLAPLNEVSNLPELVAQLEILKDLEYFWINFLVGIRLKYGTQQTGTWGTAEIWHHALEPWNVWAR